MNIYLLRHAIAIQRGTAGYPNDDRPLTEDGIEKMERGAKGIVNLIDRPGVILTSPLRRALDTARIVGEAFRAPGLVKITDALLPASGHKELNDEMAKYKSKESLLLVGHSPDLEAIAGSMLGTTARLFEFKKGGMCAIEVDGIPVRKPGHLAWLVTPKQLRSLA